MDLLRKRVELKVSSKDTGVAEALRFWLLTCSFAGASLPQNSMRGNRSIHNPKFDASRASLLTEPKRRRKRCHLLNWREARKRQKPHMGYLECQARACTQMSEKRP
jgi:hypothetical protein